MPVNTAARVQAAAAAGQVWVDETTRLLTTSAIAYVDVGSHRMKGKADPVPLWAVRAVVANVGGAQRADGLEAPLVGSRPGDAAGQGDLPRRRGVRSALAAGGRRRGRGRQDAHRVGVREVRRRPEHDGALAQGRCLSYGEGVAYFALAEAIRGRLQLTHGADPVSDEDVEPGELLESGLERYVPDLEERELAAPAAGRPARHRRGRHLPARGPLRCLDGVPAPGGRRAPRRPGHRRRPVRRRRPAALPRLPARRRRRSPAS